MTDSSLYSTAAGSSMVETMPTRRSNDTPNNMSPTNISAKLASPNLLSTPASPTTITTPVVANGLNVGGAGAIGDNITSAQRTTRQPQTAGVKTSLPAGWGAPTMPTTTNRNVTTNTGALTKQSPLVNEISATAALNHQQQQQQPNGEVRSASHTMPRTLGGMHNTSQHYVPTAMNAGSTTSLSRHNTPNVSAMPAAGLSPNLGLINPPSLVTFGSLRILIADAPSDHTLPLYIKEFERYNVTDVIRVCEPTYKRTRLEELGYRVHDWPFDDGDPPPDTIIEAWLALLDEIFNDESSITRKEKEGNLPSQERCVAIHCVAGLGRAPVLVAIALIEHGMSPLDSVAYVRERRRGAINQRQLRYVERYKRHARKGCIIC